MAEGQTADVQRELWLIGGGVRAGKSRFALDRARQLGTRRVFVATAIGFDAEMQARIHAHREERGDEFETIEVPYELCPRLAALADIDVVVIDCLTLWLSNLLLRGASEAELQVEVDRLARLLEARRFHALVVTNEVGMGVVPESALGRSFRDVAGRAHQRLAQAADRVYFALLGTLVRLKPGPLVVEGGSDAPV